MSVNRWETTESYLTGKCIKKSCLTQDTLFLLVAVRLPNVFTEPLKICMINLSRFRFRAVLIENSEHRRESYVISLGTCEQIKKRGWKKVLELKFHITVATSQGHSMKMWFRNWMNFPARKTLAFFGEFRKNQFIICKEHVIAAV